MSTVDSEPRPRERSKADQLFDVFWFLGMAGLGVVGVVACIDVLRESLAALAIGEDLNVDGYAQNDLFVGVAGLAVSVGLLFGAWRSWPWGKRPPPAE